MEDLLLRESPAASVAAPVVSIEDVTHRYGASLALDGFRSKSRAAAWSA